MRPGGAEAGGGTQATGQTVASLDAPVAALPGPTQRREGGEGAWLALPGTGFPPTQTGAVFLVQRECLCVLLRVATDPPSAWGGSGRGLALGASTPTGHRGELHELGRAGGDIG